MLVSLYRSAAAWTAFGLLSGLFYRDFTKMHDFVGYTQLAVLHTHALTLGTIALLLFMLLDRQFGLGADRRFKGAVHAWNTGLVITLGTMLVKGSFQVLHNPQATSKALAGIAGLGHITLTVAFALLFLALGSAVRRVDTEQ